MLKLSARTVSVLFVLPLPGYLFGAWLSARLSYRLSQGKLMRLGIAFLALGSLIILVPGLLGMVSAASLVGGAAVYFIGSGILYPTATSCAIEPFPGQAGTAGAILGGMQNLGPAWSPCWRPASPWRAGHPGDHRDPDGADRGLELLWLRHHGAPGTDGRLTRPRARPVGGLYCLLPGGGTPQAVEGAAQAKEKARRDDGLF